MNSDFSDPQRAVAYITSGLASEFPEGEVEVIAFRGPHIVPRHLIASTKEVRPLLDRFCHDYRGVSVRFTPQNAYGMVATMESHPEFSPGGSKSKHPEENPRIVILLRRNADQDVLVGTRDHPPVWRASAP
ncbi:MAG: hypothetical protein RBU21_01530 [FCB group bacterium]|jgi:hypothetical protein|nr:hypothetical protein [FCB group bacterium]